MFLYVHIAELRLLNFGMRIYELEDKNNNI